MVNIHKLSFLKLMKCKKSYHNQNPIKSFSSIERKTLYEMFIKHKYNVNLGLQSRNTKRFLLEVVNQ